MQSHYEKLVKEQGKKAANAYMRELRRKRTTYDPAKLGFSDPAVRLKALKIRKANYEADDSW